MWDDRIDEAARELTRGKPGGDFRARVIARIDEGPAKAGHYVWKWTLVPTTAAVAIALVIFMSWMEAPIVRPGTTATSDLRLQPELPEIRIKPDPTNVASMPAINVSGDPVAERLEIARTASAEGTTAKGPDRATALFEEAPRPAGFESLEPQPLGIAEIQIGALEPPDPVVVEALSVSPLEVGALDATSSR